MKRIDEYTTKPSNPKDADTYRDSDGMQWAYIGKVSQWGIDLNDHYTREKYYSIDNFPEGYPTMRNGISGKDSVFRWLDEN